MCVRALEHGERRQRIKGQAAQEGETLPFSSFSTVLFLHLHPRRCYASMYACMPVCRHHDNNAEMNQDHAYCRGLVLSVF